MRSFSEIINDDLSVFVNPEEMGSSITFDGVEVDATIIRHSIDERKRLVAVGNDVTAPALFYTTMTVYIRYSDVGYIPVTGQPIDISGQRMYVLTAGEDKGMLKISFELNDSC